MTGETCGTCEYVEPNSGEECGDDAQQYNIKNVRVCLCGPHLEAVFREEGLDMAADQQQGQRAR